MTTNLATEQDFQTRRKAISRRVITPSAACSSSPWRRGFILHGRRRKTRLKAISCLREQLKAEQESFKSRPECLLRSVWNDTLASRADIPRFSHLRSDSSQITPLLPRAAAAGNYTPTQVQGEVLSLALEDSPYTPQVESKQCRAARHFLPSKGGLQSANCCFQPLYWKLGTVFANRTKGSHIILGE